MTKTNDALERLRNRAKPKVESRNQSNVHDRNTVHNSEAAAPTADNNLTASGDLDVEISTLPDISTSSSQLLNQDKQNTVEVEFATKQTTIRLEKQILQRISQVCQESEISREVLLESLFVNFENNEANRAKIIKQARKRDERRKEIANQRRAKSMIKRYG
ncbi:MAG: hypothetical protein AAFR77_03805 [Cyanobacteria bacterium J06631_2]